MPKLEGPLATGQPVFDPKSDKSYMVMGTGRMKLAEDINSDDSVPSVIIQDDDGNVETLREDHFRDRYALLTVARPKGHAMANQPNEPVQNPGKDVPVKETGNKQPDPAGQDAGNARSQPNPASNPAGKVGTKNTEDR
jgi:hypothetical protein